MLSLSQTCSWKAKDSGTVANLLQGDGSVERKDILGLLDQGSGQGPQVNSRKQEAGAGSTGHMGGSQGGMTRTLLKGLINGGVRRREGCDQMEKNQGEAFPDKA